MKIKIAVIAIISMNLSVIAQDETIKGKLVVNEGSIRLKSTASNSRGLELTQNVEDNQDVSRVFNYYKGPLLFGTMNNERLRIDEDGNVGIGTTNPSVKLDVIGAIKSSVNVQSSRYYVSGSEALLKNSNFLYLGTGNFSNGIYTNKRIRTTEDIEPYLDLDGNLGASTARWNNIYGNTLDLNGVIRVGTTTSGSHKLAVEGSIGAREIKVEAFPSWSDFVFERNYDLPTLKEVEDYIQEKGHLKDIPSAKEVEQNGFFLGEMNSKLLQKIEELTLYTIKQEKKIKEQSSKIEKQELDITELKSLNEKLIQLQSRLEKLESKK